MIEKLTDKADHDDRISYLCAISKPDRARQIVEARYARFRTANARFKPERDQPVIAAQLAYCLGDAAQFRKCALRSEEPMLQVEAELTSGSLERAESICDQYAKGQPFYQMVLYLAAAQRRNNAMADRHLAQVAVLLAKSDRLNRMMVEAIQGNAAVSAEKIVMIPAGRSSYKALNLAVLGMKDPAHRAFYFDLARKLNFDRAFPHLLLYDILGSPGGR
jgi:hypothetical protein